MGKIVFSKKGSMILSSFPRLNYSLIQEKNFNSLLFKAVKANLLSLNTHHKNVMDNVCWQQM